MGLLRLCKKCPDVIKSYGDKENHQILRNYAYLN